MCEVPVAQSYERQKILESKERRMLEMQQMNLFSNEFLSVALADILACQHVLRVLTGVSDLRVVEVRTQYRVVYPVKKYFEGTNMPYDDGISVLYVNAEVNDGSDVAKMMEYFRAADPADRSQGDLSDRVHFLKCEEGGFQIMCEITEKWLKEGIEIGKMETAVNLAKMGFTVDKIAQAVQVSASVVKQWLEGNVSTIQ